MRTHVIKDGNRFRLCTSKRTPRGPRRRNLVTLGTHKACRTVSGALAYWLKRLNAAMDKCKAECEAHPDTYKKRRTWQREAARSAHAAVRRKAIIRFDPSRQKMTNHSASDIAHAIARARKEMSNRSN